MFVSVVSLQARRLRRPGPKWRQPGNCPRLLASRRAVDRGACLQAAHRYSSPFSAGSHFRNRCQCRVRPSGLVAPALVAGSKGTELMVLRTGLVPSWNGIFFNNVAFGIRPPCSLQFPYGVPGHFHDRITVFGNAATFCGNEGSRDWINFSGFFVRCPNGNSTVLLF